MASITIPPPGITPADSPPSTSLVLALRDTLAIAKRNLYGLARNPITVVFATIQPIIFVLMFRYVFGGSIHIPGVRYVDYLMPAIFIQTVTFGAQNTGIGLATDLQTGLIQRFRTLPMARSAVLAGRTVADLVRNVFVVILMVGIGYAVGFRAHTGALPFLAANGLILLFGWAMSWVMALIGLATGNAEAAQAASFPILALLVFASSAFVSPDTMPGPLKAFASHQPVTANINAIRALVLGGPTSQHVVVALAWSLGIIVVFAALATARYRRAG
jgi:ABC-2 type transport system permease protein/oleandomycin transport system permease protein